MRIIFIGAVEFSRRALKRLIDLDADIVGVVTKKESPFNSDFADLSVLSRKNGIPFKYVTDVNALDSLKWMKSLDPDVIFCFGFSQILKKGILSMAPGGVIGYHPAALPRNRGRHPLVWALALGLDKTASTFFFMDKTADSGDILDQREMAVRYRDDARSLYDRMTKTALKQIDYFLPRLEKGNFRRVRQDAPGTNYWRPRREEDGQVDFRMTSRAVYNLVRALTRPYAGAHVLYNGAKVKVWEAREAPSGAGNHEHGKVLRVRNGQILVKCYDNAILFTEHEFNTLPEEGEYLL